MVDECGVRAYIISNDKPIWQNDGSQVDHTPCKVLGSKPLAVLETTELCH